MRAKWGVWVGTGQRIKWNGHTFNYEPLLGVAAALALILNATKERITIMDT